jgi:hypothetical protein
MIALPRRKAGLLRATLLVLPFALAACGGDGNGLRGAAELTGFATTPQASKPFVQATRPATTDYIPVGTTVSRTARQKTPEEFKALEAELEAKRLSNDAAGSQAKTLGATQAPPPAAVTLPD